jgi:hypothetical protein
MWSVTCRFPVGVGRFELPASSSRTKRAAKLRYTPHARNLSGTERDLDSLAERQTRSGRAAADRRHGRRARYRDSRGTRVSRLASGRQANRAGAVGDVPSPAETCSQACPSAGWWCSPRARSRSIPQLVTSVP